MCMRHSPPIVLTRDPQWRAAGGVLVAGSLDDALRLAADLPGEVFVAGGAGVYAAALDRAHAQVLTEVHLSPEGDTHYPEFDRAQWVETRREAHADGEVRYDFVWLARA